MGKSPGARTASTGLMNYQITQFVGPNYPELRVEVFPPGQAFTEMRIAVYGPSHAAIDGLFHCHTLPSAGVQPITMQRAKDIAVSEPRPARRARRTRTAAINAPSDTGNTAESELRQQAGKKRRSTITAAGRRRIAAAMKKRWAAKRAEGATAGQ